MCGTDLLGLQIHSGRVGSGVFVDSVHVTWVQYFVESTSGYSAVFSFQEKETKEEKNNEVQMSSSFPGGS
jgi:hypothetical protein